MFYCEACRVVNAWPTGIGQSRGPCEVCGYTRECYDVPSKALPASAEVRSIHLIPVDDTGFHMSQLIGVRQFNVTKILGQSPQRVALEYARGDMADPATDPLIIGTIEVGGGYKVRVLWDNRLWRPSDPETDQFLQMMQGVKVKKGNNAGSGLRIQHAGSGGTGE